MGADTFKGYSEDATITEDITETEEPLQNTAINIQFHSGYTDTGYTGKKYTYKHNLNDVSVGDLVVVQTSGQYKIVRVSDVAVPVTMPMEWYKWVVCKFEPSVSDCMIGEYAPESPGG